MEVWVVEELKSGEWSVKIIFDSKEKANDYVKNSNRRDWEIYVTKMKVQ